MRRVKHTPFCSTNIIALETSESIHIKTVSNSVYASCVFYLSALLSIKLDFSHKPLGPTRFSAPAMDSGAGATDADTEADADADIES
jgi:hypothetical protein